MEHLAPPPESPALLAYQPRFECSSGELAGARLHVPGPDGSADAAIASAGDLPMLRAACQQVADWSRGRTRPFVLSLGARLAALCDPAFAQALSRVLLDTRLTPCTLEFAIVTGHDTLSDTEEAALQHLKRCGIRLSIDAASPANAHLAWARRLPLDSLEVPSRLVQDVVVDPEGVAIVRALVNRAHKMGLSVYAAGIGDAHTASVMTAAGCDETRGPLFCGAEPADRFAALMKTGLRIEAHLQRAAQPERTLLLVDDEANILAALRRLLRREGYTILTATGGKEGLELLATHSVDVIVSDQRMPGMTGVEFLRKAKDMAPDTVRMVLSGYTDLQSVTDAINEGAIYKFLTKPWDDAMLVANIDEAFRRKLLSDENRRLSTELSRANSELERINAQLKCVLADRERRLGMGEASLGLAQEALATIPLPLMGLDPGGMIALANGAAERLFPGRAPLIGLDAVAVLPPELLARIGAAADGAGVDCPELGCRIDVHPLGGSRSTRGTLLTFNRGTPAP
jgi:EAL domain-containing protein (putative c-di-GMP-specific phosphodiesterase class I)/CheY-like chemotaxis protein